MSDKKKKIIKGLNRFERLVISVESLVAVAAFAGMCLIVMYGIICRFILKIPNPYGEELSRYLMIDAVFFAVAIGVVKNEHIRVDFFVDRLPGMAGKLVDALGGLVTVFGYLLLTYLTAQVFGSMIQKGQLAPSLRIPMYIPYAGMLVGMALAALQAVEMFIQNFSWETGERRMRHDCLYVFSVCRPAFDRRADFFDLGIDSRPAVVFLF